MHRTCRRSATVSRCCPAFARAGDGTASGFRLPGYLTARLNLLWQVSHGVRPHLDAENLFDRDYFESSYSDMWITPGAPRTVRARLALAL